MVYNINFRKTQKLVHRLTDLTKKHYSVCANLIHDKNSDIRQKVKDILHGAQVLLVDDNDINREITKNLLQSYDIEVDLATDGQDAIDILKRKKYDLILMDIHMPNMDGISAAEAIRNEGKNITTPIVALSASSVKGHREQSIQVGMNEYIAKPINPYTLQNTLLRWIADLELSGKQEHFITRDNEEKGQNINTHSIETFSSFYNQTDLMYRESLMDNSENTFIERNTNHNEIVNKDVGLINVGGNENLYIRLVTRFVENYADTFSNIRSAIKEHDRELALRLAHTIKGVAASLGAHALSSSSKALESSLRNNEEKEFLIIQAEEDLILTLEAFNIILGKTQPSEKEPKAENSPQNDSSNPLSYLREELIQLPPLMEKDIIKAGEHIQNLNPHLKKHLPLDKVEALNSAYNDVDFAGVEFVTKEMLELLEKE